VSLESSAGITQDERTQSARIRYLYIAVVAAGKVCFAAVFWIPKPKNQPLHKFSANPCSPENAFHPIFRDVEGLPSMILE
jgi:hypothetical protein